MKKLTLLLTLLLAATVAFGQDPAPAPTPVPDNSACSSAHFSISASASGFNGAGQASPASVEDASVCLTKSVSLMYENVQIPDINAVYHFGLVNYNRPVRALFGKKLASKFVFNPAPWSFDFFGGAGVVKQDSAGVAQQHIAEAVGTGLRYQANGHVSFRVISVEYLHANLQVGANQFLTTPNNWNATTGIALSF